MLRRPLRHELVADRAARDPAGAAQRRARDATAIARRRATAPGGSLDRLPALGEAQRDPLRRGRCAGAARRPLTNLPVSIPTGQASSQVPSAAQVSSASYSNSSSSASSTAEPGAWRAISRRRTIRWRGVVVRLRLGQTGSQKPHSTQVVASSSIGGVVFRFLRWMSGSSVSTTPGASTPSGSAARLTRRISSVAFAPHSRSTNGAMFTPVPCSALSEPSYLSITSSIRALHERCRSARGPPAWRSPA